MSIRSIQSLVLSQPQQENVLHPVISKFEEGYTLKENTDMSANVFEKTFFMGGIQTLISAMDLSPNNNLLAVGDSFG